LGGQRAGFSATAQINRRHFGIDIIVPMDGGGVVVGDKVSISLEVEVGRQLAPTDGSVEQAGGTRRGPISPEDHNAGDACIGYLEFNE
jgi:hypothetical protein